MIYISAQPANFYSHPVLIKYEIFLQLLNVANNKLTYSID